MTRNEFVAAVLAIAARKPDYRLGGDGSDGTCDCIGLIIGAAEACGEDWVGTHGSNWAARHYTSGLVAVTDRDDLVYGDLVYKAAVPGSSGYALPSRYNDNPDRRDYYHVGVVTNVNPLEITHCTTPDGIHTDTSLGRWGYRGTLTLIDEESEEDASVTGTMATVTAPSGKTVNLRKSPNGSAALVDRVPVGATVDVLSLGEEWSRIRYGNKSGYMMTVFLASSSIQEPAACTGDINLQQRVAELTRAVEALQERVTKLEGGVSGG